MGTRSWDAYLGPKWMIMGRGEGFTMRNLIVSTNYLIVKVIESKWLRWAVYLVTMEEGVCFQSLRGKSTVKSHLRRHLDIDGRTMLE